MRVTDIKTSNIGIPYNPPGNRPAHAFGHIEKTFTFTLVQVETDEGISGVGVQLGRADRRIDKMVRDFLLEKPFDPFDIELAAEFLRKNQPFHGQASAVEVALWDIMGKATNKPISKLLGGYRNKLLAYLSTNELREPEQARDEAAEWLEKGFKAVKLRVHHVDLKKDIEVVKAVREVVGDKMDIMVDANQSWKTNPTPPLYTRQMAIWMARHLEEYNVLWLEEPLPRHDIEGLRELCDKVDIAIAGGEFEYGLYTFRELIDQRALDIIQVDATLSGGLLEAKKIAAMAQAFGKWCIPHAWSAGPGVAANLQLCCSISNCPYFEYPLEKSFDLNVRDRIITEPITVDKDGYVHLPDKPGLGVELDYDAIRKYTID